MWPCFVILQWSAVITRSNIVRYYIKKQELKQYINQMLGTARGRAMGVFCEYLWENLPHYNDTTLCVVITRSDITTRRLDITEPLWVWAIPITHYNKKVAMFTVLPPTAYAVRTNAFHWLNMSDCKHNFTLTEFNRLEWCLAKRYIVW